MKHPLVKELTHLFTKHADPTVKPRQEAYMRHQFSFFGINQPKRLACQKILFKSHTISTMDELADIVKMLWRLQTREGLYTATDLLKKYKKLWNQDTIELFKYCILTDSWWDTIDDLAANCVGPLCKQFPELIHTMDTWVKSDEMWLRRSAILFQLKYKKTTDIERLFSYCKATMHEKEFFIRKAIGWVLREYSKTDPIAVRQFVSTYAETLSPLSKREALKYCQ